MVKLTSCQKLAHVALSGAENVFLSGAAGSGKSFLVNHYLREKDVRTFPVLASTGAAAVLVGGRTFHSFFGLGILEGGPEQTIERASANRQVMKRVKQISGFILDEVSMISGPVLRTAEIICRRIRRNESPWGGLRVIAVGDFAQLPPVDRLGSHRPWAFLDPVWGWSAFQTVYLQTQTRCRDEDYMRILNRIRVGQVDEEVREYLDAKITPPLATFQGTRLFPRREETERFNLSMLMQLPGELKAFASIFSGNAKAVEQLKKSAPVPDVLQIKDQALVMLRQNDPQGRWVNGTTGYIEKIGTGSLAIRLLSGRKIEIEKATFSLLDAEGEVVAACTNFPVTLAWATTIHKSQGSTLDRMMVNLRNLWEPGQAYVALSRVSTGQDLCIEGWTAHSIKTDPEVTGFYRQIQESQASLILLGGLQTERAL